MKSLKIALESGSECGCALCQLLAVAKAQGYGVSSPETIKAFNEMRASNGYKGAPVFGKGWVRLIEGHEIECLNSGLAIPEEYTALGFTPEFNKALEQEEAARVARMKPIFTKPVKPVFTKPVFRKPVVNYHDKATKAFQQVNARVSPDPVRKLDTTPFAGLGKQ